MTDLAQIAARLTDDPLAHVRAKLRDDVDSSVGPYAAQILRMLPLPDAQARLDGNDIWEALFSIFKGAVPDEMTEAVCAELAQYLRSQAHG